LADKAETAAEYDCVRVFANALTQLAARWQIAQILTAFGSAGKINFGITAAEQRLIT
jgi:hypothetical protein